MRVLIVAQSDEDVRIDRACKILLGISEVGRTDVAYLQASNDICFDRNPFMVIALLPVDREQKEEVVYGLRERFKGPILAISGLVGVGIRQRLIQLGADEVMDDSLLEDELEQVVWRLLGRRSLEQSLGEFLCVVSASGGCGSSTLAVNLAADIANREKSCVLIDMNSKRGDLSSLLDVKAVFTLADLCRVESRLDHAMFEKMLVRHNSGIRLLGAPLDYSEIDGITPQGIRTAMELVRKWYNHTVVDLENVIYAEQIEAIHQATGIFVVTRLAFSSICQTRRLLKHLESLGIHEKRVRVVVNQHGQASELLLEDAEQALGMKLTHLIPYEPKTINPANNTGQPAVLRTPGSRVAKCIAKLAATKFELRTNPVSRPESVISQLARSFGERR